jgi:hypothetical protein
MIERYLELSPFLTAWPHLDPELQGSLLSVDEEEKLKGLYDKLKSFNSVSMTLQSEPTPHLANVRGCFDILIQREPLVASKIGAEADLIHSPLFETAIVKVINDQIGLTLAEEEALSIFRNIESEDTSPNLIDINSTSVIDIVMAQKKRKVIKSDIDSMKLIPATSNIVERLFSKVGHVFSSPRKSMDALTLEDVVFLKENASLWNAKTVNDLLIGRK